MNEVGEWRMQVSDELWTTLSAIFAGLAVVQLAFLFLRKYQPQKDFTTIRRRIQMWWGMFFVFGLAALIHPVVSLLSLMTLCFFALKEFFSMTKSRKADRRIYLWAYLSIPIQFWWIYTGWYGMFVVFIPVYVFLFLPLPRLLNKGTIGFVRSVSSTQWGLMLMVFGLSHLAFFPFASPEHGSYLVLFLVTLTQLNDFVHTIVSMYIGRRKIVPTANPNLTWEGFAVALGATIAASLGLYSYLTPFDAGFAFWAGLLIGVTGFFGSLTISVLRRDLLIGDDEKAEAHREGYLTRIDSLTYTSPIFLHAVRYFFEFM